MSENKRNPQWIDEIFQEFNSKKGVVIFLEDIGSEKPIIKKIIKIDDSEMISDENINELNPKNFTEIFNRIKNFDNKKIDPTIINTEQLDVLTKHLLDIIEKNIDGEVVELGCYVGESSKILMKTIIESQSDKKLYVYDSFEGLPPLSKWEINTGWKPGTLNTTEDVLIENFTKNELPPPIIYKGWFKDIPEDKIPEKISFAFLDGDFFDSIYDSLNKIYDRVVDGGYICFHDYLRNDLPGVKEAIEQFFNERNIKYSITLPCEQLGIIQKNKKINEIELTEVNIVDKNIEEIELIDDNIVDKNLTIVTGLWNLNRPGRDFDSYLREFRNLLNIDGNLFIYLEKQYEHIVWENPKRNKKNTFLKIYELTDIKNLYLNFWDRTEKIRENPDWYNQASWLSGSPQATLEYYNPIVMSKYSMLNDVTIWNPFNTDYFIWLDAGITFTVPSGYFTENNVLDKIIPHLKTFLFLSYPYDATNEIHGFKFDKMNRYAKETVKYVCRGGLFGGHKDIIQEGNGTYWHLLNNTLNEGLMGTEESIFTIMAYNEPHTYRRYSLDGNGLIVKFIENLHNDNIQLVPVAGTPVNFHITKRDIEKVKTNVYILTFNFPEQVQNTLNSMEKVPEWLHRPHIVLIDNSTDENAVNENKIIAEKYNMEYIKMDHNTGICGGRQKAAEHFHESDADYMLFFEDDMTINSQELEGKFCRNGFRKYIPNLYDIIHKIMLKENFDFLKLSFTEVYFDNDKSLPWYNVPQKIRTRDWPHYDKLPTTGLDPNSPPASYKHIKVCDGVAYIIGDVNYCNWPMIVSKEGNKKMFIDTKWNHPYEQTWSSHIYQITKEGKIYSGLLLASPILHERIKYYKPEERREN